MERADGERLATLEEAIRGLTDDVRQLRDTARDDQHRLRRVEESVVEMVTAQKQARRDESEQYRRLELRLQVLTATIAIGSFVMGIAVAFIHY